MIALLQTGAGPRGPAPSTQRISGQNTLTAASVDGAPGDRHGGDALRRAHVQDSLQDQKHCDISDNMFSIIRRSGHGTGRRKPGSYYGNG